MRRTRSIFGLWCLLMLIGAPAVFAAGDYQLGLAAYSRGDYTEALEQWLPLAQRGQDEAQYRVGRLYYYGRGVELSYPEAARWYLAAAEQGHARSQSNLGLMYEQGLGVEADLEQALRWLTAAAESGRAVAQTRLATLYEEGRGVAVDDARAASLYLAAAKQGNGEAQHRLSRMYAEGRGVEADPKKADRWASRAARNGYLGEDAPVRPAAVAATATAGAAAVAVAATAAPPPVPVDSEPVEDSTISPADPPAGDFDLGMEAYEQEDYATALREWQALAAAGVVEAQYGLATLYRLGQGVETDLGQAGLWYREAAEAGHGMSMYYLGFMYLRGQGIVKRKDPVRAYLWFTRAADSGVGDAAAWRDTTRKQLTGREAKAAAALLDEQGETEGGP